MVLSYVCALLLLSAFILGMILGEPLLALFALILSIFVLDIAGD